MSNILIVDDSRTSRKVLTHIFEDMGHAVVGEAGDGEEGFLKFKELRPDLVTLDITMPKMNGLEALQLIMNEDSGAKVVMISSAGQKDKMLKAIKMGAKDFVTKPIDDDVVQTVISEALQGE